MCRNAVRKEGRDAVGAGVEFAALLGQLPCLREVGLPELKGEGFEAVVLTLGRLPQLQRVRIEDERGSSAKEQQMSISAHLRSRVKVVLVPCGIIDDI